jgi:hypothetical protein
MNEFLLVATATLSLIAPIFLTLLVMGIYVFLFALVIICLMRVARYFGNAGKEQKLMRMEMGKLAEEVHLLRRELEGGKKRESSAESG